MTTNERCQRLLRIAHEIGVLEKEREELLDGDPEHTVGKALCPFQPGDVVKETAGYLSGTVWVVQRIENHHGAPYWIMRANKLKPNGELSRANGAAKWLNAHHELEKI